MTIKRGGLGRNLSALLTPQAATSTEIFKLAITQIQPGKYQPRTMIDNQALVELAASIKQQGLLQPILVREIAQDKYEIIAGERRWRACQLAGIEQIPVIVHQVNDETTIVLALIENLQRADLNPIEQARGLHRLTTEFSLTHQQAAELLSMSRAAVTNYLRLLHLMPEVLSMVECKEIEMGHARALLVLDEKQQLEVAKKIISQKLSVRETEAIIARLKENLAPVAQSKFTARHVNLLLQDELRLLATQLKTKIHIKPGKNDQGSLIIHYSNHSALETILQRMLQQLPALEEQ